MNERTDGWLLMLTAVIALGAAVGWLAGSLTALGGVAASVGSPVAAMLALSQRSGLAWLCVGAVVVVIAVDLMAAV